MKKYPGWKNAAEIILQRFDTDGYGIVFSEHEILDMLDMKRPNYSDFKTFQQFNLDRLFQMDKLTNFLREEHNICLENVRGEGYMVMHPNDQVTKTADKYKRQARGKIKKLQSVLTNVDFAMLSDDARKKLDTELGKAAFIRAAMNKRKVLTE